MYTFSKISAGLTKPVFSLIQKPVPVTHIGPGKVDKVSEIIKMNHLDNVLVITDAGLVGLGLLDAMFQSFEENGIRYSLYDQVKPDPTYTIAREGLKMCKENKCQGIVAFGGGSVIDTAKAVSVAYTNNKEPQAFKGVKKVKKLGMPFIAIPTTAGTGSEATLVSVISDPVTHQKTTMIDPKLVPNFAVLDPELTVGLPPHITASTAIDALTHAIEAYISKNATEETKKYSEISIKLIYDHLENVYNNPKDIEGREALLVASFYGGLAFTRAFIGYVHAFAHNVGGKFGVPHGLANAVLLPHIMAFSKSSCEKDFAKLAELVNVCDKHDSNSAKADKFIQSLFDLNKKLEIPQRLEKFDKGAIADIRKAGFKECHGAYPVPKYLTAKQADEILGKICAL